MNRKSRYLALASVILMLSAIFNPSPAIAQTGTGAMSVAEFREKYIVYLTWLDSNTSPSRNLAMKVQEMSDEEFKALYDSYVDPDAFIVATEQAMVPIVQTKYMTTPNFLMPAPATSTITLYTPDYPQGWWYDKWIFALPGLGVLSDTDGNGSISNDRCSSDGAAWLATVATADKAAAVVADTTCNSFPDGVKIPFCIAAGILHEIEVASETLVDQCASQDGSVDGAEIEATYENSKIISGQISTHDTEIKAILEANHTEVMDTLARNQAQLLKIEIEKELSVASDNKRLSYFYLPTAQGGLLELVRQTVLDMITANKAAGMSIGNAQSWFTKADASLAKGNYKSAFDQYKKAYLEAVK